MLTRKGEAAPGATGATSVVQPRTTSDGSQSRAYDTTSERNVSVLGSHKYGIAPPGENGPSVHISRRSPLVPATFLGLIVFAVCYLAGHIAAVIFGWHGFVYVGVGVGVGLVVSCFVAFCLGAGCSDD
jgi:hypothetical protein